MKKCLINNQSGFSIAEALIAALMLGMLAVGGMKLMENQAKSTKQSESKNEIIMLSQQLNQILQNNDACVNTLSEIGNLAAGLEHDFQAFKNQDGRVMYRTYSDLDKTFYGNNSIIIEKMMLKGFYDNINKSYDATTIPDAESTGDVTVEVTFRKASKLTNQGALVKRFPVRVSTDETGAVSRCFSLAEGAVDTAREETCNDVGGTFDVNSGCDIAPVVEAKACEILGGTMGASGCSGAAPRDSLSGFCKIVLQGSGTLESCQSGGPATCSGSDCSCPAGFSVMQTGMGRVQGRTYEFYSCMKN